MLFFCRKQTSIFNIKYCFVLIFAIFVTYKLYNYYLSVIEFRRCLRKNIADLSLIESTQDCLRKKFEIITPNNFDKEWLMLNETVNKCTDDLIKTMKTEEFQNNDEIKIGILPKDCFANCKAITLGIGRDVNAEKELLRKLPQCKFIGVDPDPNESGKLFTKVTKGKYIEGAIGVKSGIYDTQVIKDNVYKPEQTPHFSLKELFSQNYENDAIIDYFFMDIEGDEFELVKELINNLNEYPTICQLYVEFHTPDKIESRKYFFETMTKSMKEKLYLPLKVDPLHPFNRIFFININEKCLNKFYQ